MPDNNRNGYRNGSGNGYRNGSGNGYRNGSGNGYKNDNIQLVKNKGKFPYNFVPVKPELVIEQKPNDKLCLLTDCNSGELNITFTTLTPSLFGHYQTKFSNASDDVKNEINNKIGPANGKFIENDERKEKNIIEPLMLRNASKAKGAVVIPSTTIKGMIRQSVSSLLDAPMSKNQVADSKNSFRPNLQIDSTETIIPAILVGQNKVTKNFMFKFGIMKDFYFCRKSCQDSIMQTQNLSLGRPYNGSIDSRCQDPGSNRGKKLNSFRSGQGINFTNALFGNYHSGVDGKGELAKQFALSNPRRDRPDDSKFPAYTIGVINNSSNKTVELPRKIFQHYVKTLKYFTNEFQDGRNDINRAAISNFNEQAKQMLCKNDIVFFEIKPGDTEPSQDGSNIISMGLNFRYRWLYRDSVHTKNGVLREELYDPELEEFNENGIPEKTNMQRSLFGFVDKKKSMSGRISPNMAIEQNADRQPKDRFIMVNDCVYGVLKPLGGPKTSAVEMYLSQDNIARRKDKGIVCTYGDSLDDESAGDLNGRKGYVHQAAVNQNQRHFLSDKLVNSDSYNTNQTSIAGYITKSGIDFRGKVRFQNLSDWELGALIFAINPKPAFVKLIINTLKVNTNSKFDKYWNSTNSNFFAQKMGHARPLGLGSVACKVDQICLLNSDYAFDVNSSNEIFNKYIVAFANKLADYYGKNKQKWFDKILMEWLKIRRFENTEVANYWTMTDKNRKTTIFNFHTEIRKSHSKYRKLPGNGIPSNDVLPKLEN